MQTFKYTLLIPLRYNDGRKVSRKLLDRIMTDIYNLADGWTDAGEVTGAYRMKDGSQQSMFIGVFGCSSRARRCKR